MAKKRFQVSPRGQMALEVISSAIEKIRAMEEGDADDASLLDQLQDLTRDIGEGRLRYGADKVETSDEPDLEWRVQRVEEYVATLTGQIERLEQIFQKASQALGEA